MRLLDNAHRAGWASPMAFTAVMATAGACSLDGDFAAAPTTTTTSSVGGSSATGGSGGVTATGGGGSEPGSCGDGIQNGDETAVDCGGACKCAAGQPCQTAEMCESAVCIAGTCQPPACSDGVKNGTETGLDCGGACPGCADGDPCVTGADCQSGVCTASICQPPACDDGAKNGSETDVDCGGPCAPCADGKGCLDALDCTSGHCDGGQCVPASCVDGVENNAESDVDCGGPDCSSCADGQTCGTAADCTSGVCTTSICQAPTCSDQVKNGSETDVDCGGGACALCAVGAACGSDADCASHVCLGQTCQAPSCTDGTENGSETDVDCGGALCAPCANGLGCSADLDCVSGDCVASQCKVWSKRYGGASDDAVFAVAFDANDDLYVAGQFSGSVDLGCGVMASVNGSLDIFVAKLELTGACVWSKSYGTISPYDRPRRIAVDPSSGAVVVAGDIGTATDFGKGFVGAGPASIRMFVVKLSSADGSTQWSKAFTTSVAGAVDFALGMGVDGTGNIAIGGYFTGPTLSFGGPTPLIHAPGLNADVFVAKLSPNGSELWSRAMGTPEGEGAWSVAVDDAGNVYVGGGYGSADLDLGTGPLGYGGGQDAFLAKLASVTGATVWAKGYGVAASDNIYDVAVNPAGTRLAVGGWTNTTDWGCGPTPTLFGREALVASFDVTGNGPPTCVFSHAFSSSSGNHDTTAVAFGPTGNVLATGTFRSDLDFGAGNVAYVGGDANAGDVFVAERDGTTGAFAHAGGWGSLGADTGLAIAVAPQSGAVVVGGFFQQNIDLGAGITTSAGGNDAFLVSLGLHP